MSKSSPFAQSPPPRRPPPTIVAPTRTRGPQIWLLRAEDDPHRSTELMMMFGSPSMTEDVDPSEDEVRP